MKSKRIIIKGLVQGVGFRPAIYRIAQKFNIKGTVENNNRGVIICAEATEGQLDQFINGFPAELPIAASVNQIIIQDSSYQNYKNFRIIKSTNNSNEVTEVSPDIAVCPACILDMKSQPHRIQFPLINCTNCGPRFTIIKALPYDRPLTTMAPFAMCDTCKTEYTNVLDRRFHAQPVACNSCGPHYNFISNTESSKNLDQILHLSAQLIDRGKILAIKGMGGFHLACNAHHHKAPQTLRNLKFREGKPFALMVRDLEAAKKIVNLNKEETALLTSWRSPILLAKSISPLAPSLGVGLNTVGIMLPYMPFHHLLFEKLKTDAIILTSGNLSDEPILIDNNEAIKTFLHNTAGVITYNREIYNRTDDSVTFVVNKKPRLIRRSRGYAPSPIQTKLNTEGIFAAGAELVNCFAIGKGQQAILSQHIGDLKNLETLDFYRESVGRFSELFRFKPTLAVADLHPDYLSTRFTNQMNIPVTYVQHHHAHMAACMAEHGLSEKVIGVCFDGTGLGTDGHIWGGEFLYGDLSDFNRFTHLEYIQQPGGDAVSKQPWRMMSAYLFHYYGKDFFHRNPEILANIDKAELSLLLSMLENNINSPLTSSAGRLFDAISALLNICRHTTYHAEAPMQLEAIADNSTQKAYTWTGEKSISFKPMFEEIIQDLSLKIPTSIIAGKFHNTMVDIVVSTAKQMREQLQINTVVLSGGSFQNRILLQKTENKLKEFNFAVYAQEQVPSNDGGIALGQLAIAAQRRQLNQDL